MNKDLFLSMLVTLVLACGDGGDPGDAASGAGDTDAQQAGTGADIDSESGTRDGGEGQSSGSVPETGLQTCYDLCHAQEAAEMAGNCAAIGLEACMLICDGAETAPCWSELNALSACQLTGEFHCGLFSAESDADCGAEVNGYTSCFGRP